MKQYRSIFLSAGVPDPTAKHFMGEGDTAAISALVSALLFVALGRRPIVWGGHPAITPMMWAYAEALNVDYGKWVTLYQSEFFRDDFPEENARFGNVIVTEAVQGNRELSLEIMRHRMLSESSFDAAIFAGGMRGIFDEYHLVAKLASRAAILPIVSTGGAAAALGAEIKADSELNDELDYVALLFNRLSIDPSEPRGGPGF
ncbi:hypothetical protein IBL26_23510 [Roseomonas aerophila]|uniref:Uncharacterized protein n=1 Tax=Teichococcus aerophilus TaxID=1224513 RepID=A0ABR7RT42_9PROT|nr:hypothetical protein [Pseudoroseomonas aerophila]MBC9209825.1 hypothetical protein [Pseudoroseomonas aerophila]